MKIFLLVAAFAVSLMVIGGGGGAEVQHAGDLGQAVASEPTPYHLTGGAWSIPDLSAPQSGYAFAQTPDSTPPTFVSSELDPTTGVLTITFSETIDVTPTTNIAAAKIHIRESGNYTGGVTLTAGELGTAADGIVISFTLNATHFEAVAAMTAPELTIEPGAVQDTFGNLIDGTFDASTAVFVDATSVASRDDRPQGMAFSNDGTRMFVVGDQNNVIIEYTLSTAFDASTAVFADTFSVSSEDGIPTGMAFSNDGTKMFVIGDVGNNINEYTLSTAFDVSTASYDGDDERFSVSSEGEYPTDMAFSNDGTQMFVLDNTDDEINEYTLSTPFDISTATSTDVIFSVTTEEDFPLGIAFSNDGAKMFVVGGSGNDVNEYALSTAFDISTAVFVNATALISSGDIATSGIAFSNDGAKMFAITYFGDEIYEYALSSVYPITVNDTPTLPAGAFVTTWNVAASPYTISIPVEVRTDGTLTMDWGDGIITPVTTNGTQSHTYPASGEYQVSMTGDLSRIILGNTGSTASKLASIDQWGDIEWSSMEGAFRGASNMEYKAADAPDLSHVTSMQNMFRDASSFNGNLSDWNVSTVTNMDGTFRGASDFNGDVSSWDTSSATDMRNMFQDADNFDGDISGWDVSKVTDTSSMFYRASDFNQPLNGWDVSKVTDMSSMFYDADSFNQPLNGWDVSKVTDMSFMFFGTAIFDGDLTGWNVSKVTDMSSMFYSASSFDRPLDSWDVSKVTDMPRMFYSADSFNQPLNSWNVSAVTDMYAMFRSTAFDGDLTGWNVSKVTDMSFMFNGASSFNWPLDSWDVSKVTDMSSMFSGASSFNQPLNSWNVSAVTDMSFMFSGASSFDRPLDSWDVSKVTNMDSMFSSVTDFEQNLGKWYVVPADTDYNAATETTLVVTAIAAQNFVLDGHIPNYGIGTGGNSALFNMTGSNLMFKDTTPPAQVYKVNVTAPGGDFGTNNHRMLDITVEGQDDSTVSAGAFVTTWNVAASPYTISIPVKVRTDGTLTIDWGDGTAAVEVATNGTQSYTYLASGEYQVSMTGDLSRIILGNTGSTASKLASIDQWGDIEWSSMRGAFWGASGMEYKAADAPDLSHVTSMQNMFRDASSFNGNLSDWNVSTVTNMDSTFRGASSFNGDITGWDVSAVTNMNWMFNVASAFNGDLSGWDVSAVTNMNSMFSGASAFNGDISGWNVSAVTNMNSMFVVASAFNGDISGWNVSAVTNMNGMFFGATSFDQNLGNWYVTLDPDTIAGTGIPGVVGTISAQNQPLREHSPTYVIVDGLDKNHFEIISGNRLNMISGVSGKAEYSVNVTASGGSVFEDGNNWRILNVTVTGGVTNAVPELNSIGSQSVSELQSLTFTATATDANSGDTLTFSLTGTPPTGATITSAGVFTWTPTESQDGDHTITVQVTDGSLTDSETLTVTVNEVNVAPVLNAIGDQTVNELVELTFTATASDTDVVDNLVNTLTFSFDGTFPPGAAITSAGVFTWTPTESQDGDHTITVQVTDGRQILRR